MKKLGIFFVLLLSGLLVGCQTPAGSASERSLRNSEISKQQWRMFVDDLDTIAKTIQQNAIEISKLHTDLIGKGKAINSPIAKTW
ncbi:hypothetical protein IIB50_03155 [Patescibacteria group bacterium]|nr:hypothetical protein [Patescibacteria group bacterium]